VHRFYGTPTSPYTRIARIAAAEFGYGYEFCDLRWRVSPAELFEINPVGRVPLLVDGDKRIADSRIIWAYLEERKGAMRAKSLRLLGGSHRWDEENIVLQIYATLDATMVLRSMAETPPVTDHPYLSRSRERIDICLAAIDRTASRGFLIDPDRFGLAEAALIAATSVLKGYRIADIDRHRHIGSIRDRFTDRPSIAATRPSF
jgi:glutathione S-transferase